jgi:hypothetical protein
MAALASESGIPKIGVVKSMCVWGGIRFALNYLSLWRMRQIIKLDLECTCTLPLPLSSAG